MDCAVCGGAQMFKEPEKGNKDINIERTEEAIAEKTRCHCCWLSILYDHDDRCIKHFEKEQESVFWILPN
jgi:hypothetical protein